MSSKSVPQECQIRVSSKSVLPERSAIVSSKGVLQECHLSVSSQGVPQVGSLEVVTMSIKFLFLNIRVGIWVRGLHLVFFQAIGNFNCSAGFLNAWRFGWVVGLWLMLIQRTDWDGPASSLFRISAIGKSLLLFSDFFFPMNHSAPWNLSACQFATPFFEPTKTVPCNVWQPEVVELAEGLVGTKEGPLW